MQRARTRGHVTRQTTGGQSGTKMAMVAVGGRLHGVECRFVVRVQRTVVPPAIGLLRRIATDGAGK